MMNLFDERVLNNRVIDNLDPATVDIILAMFNKVED